MRLKTSIDCKHTLLTGVASYSFFSTWNQANLCHAKQSHNMNNGSLSAGELSAPQPVHQSVPSHSEQIASSTPTYHLQFQGLSAHISNHIRLQNEMQKGFSFRGESDNATLPLPGKVPEWLPSQARGIERDRSGVDFTQSSIAFIPPGQNPETERLRKQFAEKVAGLEQPARLDLVGFGAGRASDAAVSASLNNDVMAHYLTQIAFAILFKAPKRGYAQHPQVCGPVAARSHRGHNGISITKTSVASDIQLTRLEHGARASISSVASRLAIVTDHRTTKTWAHFIKSSDEKQAQRH